MGGTLIMDCLFCNLQLYYTQYVVIYQIWTFFGPFSTLFLSLIKLKGNDKQYMTADLHITQTTPAHLQRNVVVRY